MAYYDHVFVDLVPTILFTTVALVTGKCSCHGVCTSLLGVQDSFVESGALHIVSSTRQCHDVIASTASAELLAVVMPSDT